GVDVHEHRYGIETVILALQAVLGGQTDLPIEVRHDIRGLELGREIDLAGLEERHDQVESPELVHVRHNAWLTGLLGGSKVEPDVPGHHLALEPLDECPLLSVDLDAYRLRLVLLNQ